MFPPAIPLFWHTHGVNGGLVLRKRGEPVRDAEGHVTYPNPTDTPFVGYAASAGADDISIGAQMGKRVSAVVQAPLDLAVDEDDLVLIDATSGAPAALHGEWDVGAPRPNPLYQRVLLERHER